MPDGKFVSPWYSAKGLLYFIAAGLPPVAIKIGVTTLESYGRRLRSIQSSNHESITALGLIQFEDGEQPMLAAERKEAALHQQFAHLRRKAKGVVGQEWFDPGPELLAFIQANSVLPRTLNLPSSVSE